MRQLHPARTFFNTRYIKRVIVSHRFERAGSRTGRFRLKDRYARKLALLVASIASLVLTQSSARGQQPSLRETHTSARAHNAVIIGFVGGFVSSKDTKHPEVEFAAYLRDRYPSAHVEVFGNHHG